MSVEEKTNSENPLIVDGVVNWGEVLKRRNPEEFTSEESDIIEAAFEGIEAEVDEFLDSEEGKASLKRLEGVKQPLVIKKNTYPPNSPNGKILSLIALTSTGFKSWGYNQSQNLNTEQAVAAALHGEVKDINSFVDFIKKGIEHRAAE